jgi:hypothetical protein
MTPDETMLFTAFLKHSDRYLEFGSGGSTCAASVTVRSAVTSVDSSREWLDKVGGACAALDGALAPELIHVDIGPLGEWGRPADPATRDRWPRYHTDIWSHPGAAEADLYMVDGRFRVACFMQILLRCRRDSVILMHDFLARDAYGIVRDVARQVAGVGDLAVFVPPVTLDEARVRRILEINNYVMG